MGQKDSNKQNESLTGRLRGIRVRNQQSGFAIFELETESGITVCKGYLLDHLTGLMIQVEGVWENDSKWGRQFVCAKTSEAEGDRPSIAEIVKQLPGIGNKLALQIAEVIVEHSTPVKQMKALMDIRGITRLKAMEIVNCVQIRRDMNLLWELLFSNGVRSMSIVRKIFDTHGKRALAEFYRDPYSIGLPAGLTFQTCEKIAKDSGIPAAGSIRMRAIIQNCMEIISNNGHTCCLYPDFVETVRKRTDGAGKKSKSPYEESVSVPTIMLMLDSCCGSFLAKEKNALYFRPLRRAEISVANSVKRLLQTARKTYHDPDMLCEYASEASGVKYEGGQREAFRLLQNGGLNILTGGPGTGKTTTLRGLLAAYERVFPRSTVKLCAPTGRASQRMREATGRDAVTIHRLLEMRMNNGVLQYRNQENPIEADLLILDEASMLGIEIAALLFEAVRPGTLVILTGDTDQLPAVGPGNVLHDLLDCGKVPSVALTKILRQAEGSLIVENATRIRDGKSKLLDGDDFQIISCGSESAIAHAVLKHFLQEYDSQTPFTSQVLTPTRKRIPGNTSNATYLNEMIQSHVNPSGLTLRNRDSAFRAGDKVMMMRNNYDAGYYNGDIGVVTEIYDTSMSLLVEEQELRIGQEMFNDVELAFAATIHKSQGSEFDNVCIVLPPTPRNMLQYNLLYTAVTRARKRVTLITVPGCIGKAVSRRNMTKRKSRLSERIRAA